MARQPLIIIKPKKTALLFFYTAVVLFIFNLAGILLHKILGHADIFTNKFVHLFDASDENNIPALFTSLILFICGVLLFVIYHIQKRHVQKNKKYWLLLSLIFLFLSVDEAISIHEHFSKIKKILPSDMPGYSNFAWVLPYGFIVLIIGIFFIRFLLSIPAKTRKLLIISGSIYVIAAISFEFPESYIAAVYGVNYKYFLLCALEEFLEMTGVILFIYALLDYISFLKLSLQIMHIEEQSVIRKTNSILD